MTSARTWLKRGIGGTSRLLRPSRTPLGRRVLTFHEIGDHPWGVRPEAFAAILDAVLEFAPVRPLLEVARDESDEARSVALTFDDGYAGVVRHALPLLERRGLSATVFLPTDLLAEPDHVPSPGRRLYADAPLVGWRTVRSLAAGSPLTFESHGAGHVALPGLSEIDRVEDLRRSVAAIASCTGRAPLCVAYPFGAFDARTGAAARSVGLELGFTTRHGGLAAGLDPLALPRCDVRHDYAPRDVVAILSGAWDFLGRRRGSDRPLADDSP